jgi:hypothetical protein
MIDHRRMRCPATGVRRPGARALVLGIAAAMLSLPAAVPDDLAAQIRAQPARVRQAALPAVKSISMGTRSLGLSANGAAGGIATGGQEVVLRVELTGPAPCVERCGGKTVDGQSSGYLPVSLTTSDATQFSAQRMFVGTGQTSGELNFVTMPVATPTSFTITAATDGTPPQQARLTVQPPVMTSFELEKSSAVSGEAVKGVVHFSGPPASASAVRFQLQTTDGQAVRVPSTLTLEPNKTAVELTVQALGVAQDRTAHVVAFYLDKTLPAPLTIRAAKLASVENVYPCCDNPFRIKLDGAPPPQGAVIELTSENPARMQVPPKVTIPSGETSIQLTGQSIPGNSDTHVKITVSYNGVSRKYSLYSRKIVQPDLTVALVFYDQYDNVITTAPDGQPIRMCATVRGHRQGDMPPNIPVALSVLRVSYQSPTGTGTSSGRTEDHPIAFVPDVNSQLPPITHCTSLPGIAQGNHIDITVTADHRDDVDESREGNNIEQVKLSRP